MFVSVWSSVVRKVFAPVGGFSPSEGFPPGFFFRGSGVGSPTCTLNIVS